MKTKSKQSLTVNTKKSKLKHKKEEKENAKCDYDSELEDNIIINEESLDKNKSHLQKANRPLELLNKMHLSLASYIHNYKTSITLSGTKRFTDKTGEYYLKNVYIEKQTSKKFSKKLSLTNPTSIKKCLQKCNGIAPLKKRADEILTKLPEYSLTPIPRMNTENVKNIHDNKERVNAERTAVHIRRMEYSTEIHRIKKQEALDLKRLKKIIFIQK